MGKAGHTQPSPFELYRKWWGDLAQRQGPTTVKLYRRQVWGVLADTCWNPLTVTRSKVKGHLSSLRPNWANEIRKGLNDFFGFLVRKGYRATNPLEDIKPPRKGGKRVRRALSIEELIQLVVSALCASSNPHYQGKKLAWEIIAQYALGLRPGELLKLRPVDLSLNGATSDAYIVGTKTGDDRIMPVGPLAREALTELIRLSPGDGQLIGLSTTHWHTKVRRAAIFAGLDPAKSRPYALRHTFATHLREKGVADRVIAELMGHRDIRALASYTVPSGDDKRRAVEELG